jgi:hypothetical protein
MPHVVIEEAVDLGLACQGIKVAAARSGSEILKVVDVYLNRSGHTALVDCVVAEEGRSKAFFVQLSQKDRQITVRLLPATGRYVAGGARWREVGAARDALTESPRGAPGARAIACIPGARGPSRRPR